MATTKTPKWALEYARRFVKKPPTQEIEVDIANNVHAKIWNFANWAWTINSVSVTLSPSSPGVAQQDYNLTSNLTDCARFIKGLIISPALTGGIRTDQNYEVEPVSYIPAMSEYKGLASSFQYVPGGTDKLRLDVSALYPTNTKFYGIYKKSITLLTSQTINDATVIALPDDWYYVFQEGVLYHFYKYADDDRAGTATTTSDGKEQYTGQLAVFMEALNDMAKVQPLLYLDYKRVAERKE